MDKNKLQLSNASLETTSNMMFLTMFVFLCRLREIVQTDTTSYDDDDDTNDTDGNLYTPWDDEEFFEMQECKSRLKWRALWLCLI